MKLIDILSKRDEILQKSTSGLVPVKEIVHRKDGISYVKTVWKSPEEAAATTSAPTVPLGEKPKFRRGQKVQVYSKSGEDWFDSTVLNDTPKLDKILVKRSFDGRIFYADFKGIKAIGPSTNDSDFISKPNSVEKVTLNYKFTNGTETEQGSEAEQIDSEIAPVLAMLPFHGFKVDVGKIRAIKSSLESKESDIQDKIAEMTGLLWVKHTSKEDLKEAFRRVTSGFVPSDFTKEGLNDYAKSPATDSAAAKLALLIVELGETHRQINLSNKIQRYAFNSGDSTIQNEYSTNSRSGRFTSKGVVFTKEVELPEGFEVDKNKIYGPEELVAAGIYNACCVAL